MPKVDGHGLLEPWNEYSMFAVIYNSIVQLVMGPTWFVILTARPPGGVSGVYFCMGVFEPRWSIAEVLNPFGVGGPQFPFYVPETQRIQYIDSTTFAFLRLAYSATYTMQVGFSTVTGVPTAPASFEDVSLDGYYLKPCIATDTSNARYIFAVSSTVDNFRVYHKPASWAVFTTIPCVRTKMFTHYRDVHDFYVLFYTPDAGGDLLTLVWLEQNTGNLSGFGYDSFGGPGLLFPVDVQIIVYKVGSTYHVIACYRDTTFGRVAIAVCQDFLAQSLFTVYLGPITDITPTMLMDGKEVIACYAQGGQLNAQRAGDYRFLGNNVDDTGVFLTTNFSGPIDAQLKDGWITIVGNRAGTIHSIHRELEGVFISRPT